MADVNFTSLVTSLITCHHCVSYMVALVICKLQCIYITSGTASVYFDDADNATCKSRVGLPYSVLPVAERTIFGFGCERTRGLWIHACNTNMQYGFVLHCCDVMTLCTASQISNNISYPTVITDYLNLTLIASLLAENDSKSPIMSCSLLQWNHVHCFQHH